MSEILSSEEQATIGNENRARGESSVRLDKILSLREQPMKEKSSFEAFKNGLKEASQKLLKLIEDAEELGKTPGLEEKEVLYSQLEEVQQNISSSLETKNKNVQAALQKVLEFQKDSRIKARLISENIFILTPPVIQWLSFLSRLGEQELPKDDREMLIELSSNLQQSIPNKVERILVRFKIFNSYIRLADSSTFKDMYPVRKYAERFNKKDSSFSR